MGGRFGLLLHGGQIQQVELGARQLVVQDGRLRLFAESGFQQLYRLVNLAGQAHLECLFSDRVRIFCSRRRRDDQQQDRPSGDP